MRLPITGYLNVDEKTAYRLARRGDLPGFKVAGSWCFMRFDIDAWVDYQKQAEAGRERFEYQQFHLEYC